MQIFSKLFGGYCYLSYFCSVLLKQYTITEEFEARKSSKVKSLNNKYYDRSKEHQF